MSSAHEPDLPIAIIGAGFAGIGTAIRLFQRGIRSFTIFERADEIGGTWRDNTYPGAACDVPSTPLLLRAGAADAQFSPSSEIKPICCGWSRSGSCGRTCGCARYRRGALRRGARRLAAHHRPGRDDPARVVVAGVGGLVDPALPDLKGIESFGGEIFHTARWRHDYELTGKRVAVIGTGASAVQVVPSIASQVEKLHVFQRTPAWVVPKMDKAYSEQARRRYARFPILLRASRFLQYWTSELFGPMVFLDAPRLSALGERMSLAHLRRQVKNPELRRKLTPHFQFGCKRILVSDDYWASFERPNVELVTAPIAEITREGIRTKDGALRAVDAIVLATGFAVGLASAPFPITGRGGRALDDAWKDGAVAYKGMTISGFPNWFILMGPNTGPGHTSVLVYTEAQIEHVLGAIERLRRGAVVDVRQTCRPLQRGHPGAHEADGLAHLQQLVPVEGRQQPRALPGLRRRVRGSARGASIRRTT
jgi:cation diffusion facilitator CzcD-associated flavoprotein CzcO